MRKLARLLFLILFCSAIVSAQTHTEVTVEDNQTITGQKTFTGSPGIITSNTGNFTGSPAAQEYLQSIINSCSPATEIGGNSPVTDALTGCIAAPSASTTVHQINAVAGYANTSCNSAAAAHCNTVAGYFSGRCLFGTGVGSASACWGLNSVTQDTVATTGSLLTGYEVDMGVNGTPAQFAGLAFFGTGAGTPPTYPNSFWTAYNALTAGGMPQVGLQSNRGAVSVTGILLDGLVKTNPSASQPLRANGYDGGGVQHQGVFQVDTNGNWQITPSAGNPYNFLNSGGGLQIPGSTSGSGTIKCALAVCGSQTWTVPAATGTVLMTGNGAVPIQTLRVGGCTTTGGAAAFTGPCTVTVTWTTAFADGNYTVTCTGNGIGAGVPLLQATTTILGASTVVQTQQATGVNASFSNIECTAVHD